jgi:hypothetical protein
VDFGPGRAGKKDRGGAVLALDVGLGNLELLYRADKDSTIDGRKRMTYDQPQLNNIDYRKYARVLLRVDIYFTSCLSLLEKEILHLNF